MCDIFSCVVRQLDAARVGSRFSLRTNGEANISLSLTASCSNEDGVPSREGTPLVARFVLTFLQPDSLFFGPPVGRYVTVFAVFCAAVWCVSCLPSLVYIVGRFPSLCLQASRVRLRAVHTLPVIDSLAATVTARPQRARSARGNAILHTGYLRCFIK
jgi:hypothetical protein